MHRTTPWLLLLLLIGCQLPPDQVPVKPLPADGSVPPYADLVARTHALIHNANEMFFLDKWVDLERVADDLDRTAQVLARASDPPARWKDSLPLKAGDLAKQAARLREAAHDQDVPRINAALANLHLKVRELRAEK